MITDDAQRWTGGRASRRPAGETIRTAEYEVFPIGAAAAKAFVREHHYSGTCSSTAHTFGLGHRGSHVGTACFGPPASTNAHLKVFPSLTQKEAVTLGRLVLLDEVRVPVIGVESCADPEPRTNASGETIFRGHLGTIYCALNGRYVGRTNHATLRLFDDGTVFSNAASGKVVRADQGEDYAAGQLVAHGADPLKSGEDPLAWIRLWRSRLTRSMRHRGNYRYLWSLDKRRKRELLERHASLPYPKSPDWKRPTSTLETP